MNYLLDIAKSEMGSIQLIQEGVAQTKVHSNFPDKVNKHYQFKNNKTISLYFNFQLLLSTNGSYVFML